MNTRPASIQPIARIAGADAVIWYRTANQSYCTVTSQRCIVYPSFSFNLTVLADYGRNLVFISLFFSGPKLLEQMMDLERKLLIM